MKPSDTNLSTAEYVKYFVTDPDTIRHFNWCLNTIQTLEDECADIEYYEDRASELENEIYELEQDLADLKHYIKELLRDCKIAPHNISVDDRDTLVNNIEKIINGY